MYRYPRGGWSNEGVKTVSVTRERNTVTVTCASSHLTSFAVLVDVGGAQASVFTCNISYIFFSSKANERCILHILSKKKCVVTKF